MGEEEDVRAFRRRLQSVRAAVVGPGGKYLALYGRNRAAEQQASVVVYRPDGDSYRELKVLAQGDAPSVDWNLSAGGRLLAAGESGEIRLWDTTSWKDVTPPYLRLLKLFSPLSLSPGGHFIASGGFQGPSTLVNLSSGRVSPLPDTVMVRQIAFSQDERYLGLGLYDGFLHVFETDSPEREVARIPLGSDITALAFGDDNKYVVTASDDARAGGTAEKGGRVLRIWLLQPGNLIAEARERVRQFTQSAR